MITTMTSVAVVVLNWNGAEIISRCLDSLIKQDYKNLSIFVVDNNSTDSSKIILENYSSKSDGKVEVIYNSTNSGFAEGVNIGIRHAVSKGFKAVALFNNDAVADKNWLNQLVSVLKNDTKVGIVTGLLLDEQGKTIDSTGDMYSNWGLAFPRSREELFAQAPDSGYVFGATGGASLYRVETLGEIGLFDRRYFAYYEDVDISFRAQLMGWKVYYVKEALAYHKRGETSKRIPGFTKYQMFKNLPMLFIKNVPSRLLFSVGIKFVFIYFLMFVNASIKGDFTPAVKGMFKAIYYLPSSIGERARIQSSRKVTSNYINSIIWHDLPPNQKGILRKLVRRST